MKSAFLRKGPPKATTDLQASEDIVIDSLGKALLSSFLHELRVSYTKGGLDSVDATINGINAYLAPLGAAYWVGPGAVVEHDKAGNPKALGVPFCNPETREILTIMWVMLADAPEAHSCPECSARP